MNRTVAFVIITLFALSIGTMYSILESLLTGDSYLTIPFDLVGYASMSDLRVPKTNAEANSYSATSPHPMNPRMPRAEKSKKAEEKHDHLSLAFLHFYQDVLESPFQQTTSCGGGDPLNASAQQNQTDLLSNNSTDANVSWIVQENLVRESYRMAIGNISKTYLYSATYHRTIDNTIALFSVKNDFLINPQSSFKNTSLDIFLIDQDRMFQGKAPRMEVDSESISQTRLVHPFSSKVHTHVITSVAQGGSQIIVALKSINYGFSNKLKKIGLIDLKALQEVRYGGFLGEDYEKKAKNSRTYEEITVEDESDISCMAVHNDVVVYANKEDFILYHSKIRIGNEWKNITSHHMIKNELRLFSQTVSVSFLNIHYEESCYKTILVNYVVGQDDNMLFRGDVFCLKRIESNQEVEVEIPSNECPIESEDHKVYQRKKRDGSCTLDSSAFEWESMFSAVTKTLETEIREIDMFNLNLYSKFQYYYDENEHMFFTGLLNNTKEKSSINHFFKINSFEKENTKISKLVYSAATQFLIISARNHAEKSRFFIINTKDLDHNSVHVYRAEFPYDEDTVVKDVWITDQMKVKDESPFTLMTAVLDNGDLVQYKIVKNVNADSEYEDEFSDFDYLNQISVELSSDDEIIALVFIITVTALFIRFFKEILERRYRNRQQQLQQQQQQQPQQQQPQQQQPQQVPQQPQQQSVDQLIEPQQNQQPPEQEQPQVEEQVIEESNQSNRQQVDAQLEQNEQSSSSIEVDRNEQVSSEVNQSELNNGGDDSDVNRSNNNEVQEEQGEQRQQQQQSVAGSVVFESDGVIIEQL